LYHFIEHDSLILVGNQVSFLEPVVSRGKVVITIVPAQTEVVKIRYLFRLSANSMC